MKFKRFILFRIDEVKKSIKKNIISIILFFETIIVIALMIAFLVGKEVTETEYFLIKYGLLGLTLIISMIVSIIQIKNKYKIIYGIGLLIFTIIILIVISWK